MLNFQILKMKFDLSLIFKEFELIPKFNNLFFYNEVYKFSGDLSEKKINSIDKLANDQFSYETFLQQKSRRPNFDPYACFQPFNEAVKALYPFLKHLRLQVKKGDVILNLWDRSGWLTSLLSGLFPDQHVITTWEGNKDVLGYKGYSFWMKENKNVSILFCDLNKPLPIVDGSIAFSIGLDTLHRFDQQLLLHELMRVVKTDGAIIFPHVHLSNSEPSPFFERGGKRIHSKDYDVIFHHLTKNTNWKGFIFSELDLFRANDIEGSSSISVKSNSDTSDYNALIALLPISWTDINLSAFTLSDIPEIENSYLLINSLVKINLNQQSVFIDPGQMGGAVGELLQRHPWYLERIKKLNDYQISELATKLIYLANKGFTVKEIINTINIEPNKLLEELSILENIGLLQVLPVSFDGFRLQYYLMTQQYLISKSEQNLKTLWQNSVLQYPQNIALVSLLDDSEITYKDCDEIIKNIITTLYKNNLKKGDRVIICSTIHAEAILLFWACMHAGIVVVPLSVHLTAKAFSYILDQTEPKLCFINREMAFDTKYNFESVPIILFDENLMNNECLNFEDWLIEGHEINYPETSVFHEDGAVILFTSGSTGKPKGVQLSQGNLFRSGRLITETFFWEMEDRFFAFGGLDTMSGLRNATIAPVHVGARVIVPSKIAVTNLFNITELIAENCVTILGCNPAMLHQLVKYKDKIRNQLDTVKRLICTGNTLNNSLRLTFESSYDLSIINYYGLTETTGICTAQSYLNSNDNADNIGKPVDCIAQLVNEKGSVVPIGEEGELRIFSENLMQGYFNDKQQTCSAIRGGWFYTEDLARYTVEGNIKLLGRKRDIVKKANEELVYINNIQEFINKISFVEDSFVCSYHDENIEKIIAFIVVNKSFLLSEHEVKQEIKNKILIDLGENSIPADIKFLALLPYNEAGKLKINKLINK